MSVLEGTKVNILNEISMRVLAGENIRDGDEVRVYVKKSAHIQ